MAPPPRAIRVAVKSIVFAVLGLVWLFATAMFVTGLVMWHDWHALAKQGVDHEARVGHCEWKSMSTRKPLGPGGRGFFSCDYHYRPYESDPASSGHFQSSREWKAGEAIAIRYRPDRPSASATAKDLEHPSLLPGALMALPLLYAWWQLRAPLRRALNRQPARPPSAHPPGP